MFQPANLDDREKEIWTQADSFWGMRFNGAGSYDRLGPFLTQEQTILQIQQFFRIENTSGLCPPPQSITNRPFLVYASSSSHQQAQVVAGLVYRDGVQRETYQEYQQRRKEEKALEAKSRRSRNPKSRRTEV